MAQPASPSLAFSPPQTYLIRCMLFLALLSFPGAVLIARIEAFFFHNPILNGLILFALGLGILHALHQILRLGPEAAWANHIIRARRQAEGRAAAPKGRPPRRPKLLAPLAMLLERHGPERAFSTTAARFLLDSIASRLEDARGISRYLIGLLVFLGLLGTFWGLLETISAIGETVRSLDSAGTDALSAFTQLRAGLEAPLAGMGTAFSSSLFGLAGSLILGFLDLQAGQAQARFYIELEEFVSAATRIETEPAAAPQAAPAPDAESLAHILEDIRRLLMVAEGERALAGRNLEAIAKSLRQPAAGQSDNDKDARPPEAPKETP